MPVRSSGVPSTAELASSFAPAMPPAWLEDLSRIVTEVPRLPPWSNLQPVCPGTAAPFTRAPRIAPTWAAPIRAHTPPPAVDEPAVPSSPPSPPCAAVGDALGVALADGVRVGVVGLGLGVSSAEGVGLGSTVDPRAPWSRSTALPPQPLAHETAPARATAATRRVRLMGVKVPRGPTLNRASAVAAWLPLT